MIWTDMQVAPCGTHHLCNNVPAYKARFDQVLKFHDPGLAPVQRGDDAWHILADGSAAYARRFRRCFGFYEQLATVVAENCWHHITPDGEAAYRARFVWCGNFQNGRCSVRGNDGRYLHITIDGEPAYNERWHYAGDFRDDIAVVQAANGHATHIDIDGRYLHACWFLDLDVFHKGFARVRDEAGWFHIDRLGNPAYQNRFAAVEPFYNGQARIEHFDGAQAMIGEDGVTVATLRPPLRSEFAALSADMTGFWRTQTIYAAVTLGIFEQLPASTAGIAAHCQLSPERTTRLLRALGELMLVEGDGTGWQATSRGAYLQASHPLTLADAAVEYAVHFQRLWESLPHALQGSGEDWPTPDRQTSDIFAEVEHDEARLITHHRMLQSYAVHDYVHVPKTLGLRGDEQVVDAGGGTGVLARLLMETYPDLDMTVMDRGGVIQHAGQMTARIHQGQDRQAVSSFVAGDLFAPWPITADVVLLARVLHDWNDDDAIKILRHARAALGPTGRLFVIEMLLPEDNHAGGLCDLHLLMVTGGQERRLTQYHRLLEAAQFEARVMRHLPALPSIIEAVPI